MARLRDQRQSMKSWRRVFRQLLFANRPVGAIAIGSCALSVYNATSSKRTKTRKLAYNAENG
jgi:hypothetical protein